MEAWRVAAGLTETEPLHDRGVETVGLGDLFGNRDGLCPGCCGEDQHHAKRQKEDQIEAAFRMCWLSSRDQINGSARKPPAGFIRMADEEAHKGVLLAICGTPVCTCPQTQI